MWVCNMQRRRATGPPTKVLLHGAFAEGSPASLETRRVRKEAMTDAAVKVDPEYYSARLLASDGNAESQMAGGGISRGSLNGGAPSSWGGSGGGGGGGGMARGLPELPDYLVRQHSLLGFYLSLNPGDEGVGFCFRR